MRLLKEIFAWWTGNTWGTRLYTLLYGRRVGEDQFGNVYYQDRSGQRRWVTYQRLSEPSQVPPEWHAWLHHTVDVPPTEEHYEPRPWQKPHRPNLTGTYEAYRPPGSTMLIGNKRPQTRAYEPWQPGETQ